MCNLLHIYTQNICDTAQCPTSCRETSIHCLYLQKKATEPWNTCKITLMSRKKNKSSLSSSKLMKQVISYGSNSHFYNQNLSQEPLTRECICLSDVNDFKPNFWVYRKTKSTSQLLVGIISLLQLLAIFILGL